MEDAFDNYFASKGKGDAIDNYFNKKKSSFQEHTQGILQEAPSQVGLGLLQTLTAPLDLLKAAVQASNALGIDEAEETYRKAGLPFDREAVTEELMGPTEYIPTLSKGLEKLEETTGISTEPKDKTSKLLRTAAEFGALKPTAKKIPLKAEEEALRETAEKFGLKQFAGMEKEKPPILTPVRSEKAQEKLAQELGETSKKAIDDVISQKIPIKTMRDKGINLEEAYTTAYDSARKTSSEMGNLVVKTDPILTWIENETAKIKSLSPSPSASQKTYLNILKDEYKNLTTKTLVRKLRKSKETNADQLLNQYKNYNENVKGIWRKPEFSGSENAAKNAYAGLNEKIIESIEKVNPQLANELKFANKIFHETSKLDQVEGILSKSFKDGYNANRLNKTLGNKRERKFLERNIGKDGVQDLEKIAKYGQEAERRVFDKLKKPESVKEYLANLTPGQLIWLIGFKSHVGVIPTLVKRGIFRAQGYLFTRKPTRKAYVNFLKKASEMKENPSSLIIASKDLTKAISEEFGSEEELMKMSEVQESESHE